MTSASPLPQCALSALEPRTDRTMGGLAQGWALLTEAGEAVAELAQLGREHCAVSPQNFAMRAAVAGPHRLALVEQTIDDCAAALHVGITALIAAEKAGRDNTAAALTLWREYDRAKSALLALTAPIN